MKNGDDPKGLITELQERRKLLVLLISEYDDRIKINNLRDDELDRSIEELRVIKAQLQSIDTTLAEMEDKPNL